MPDAVAFEAFYRENLARIVRACTLVTLDRALVSWSNVAHTPQTVNQLSSVVPNVLTV